MPLNHPLYDGREEIGNQHYPSLYLDGIDAISIEEMKWKVLFQLLIKGLNSPPSTIDLGNILCGELKVIGEKYHRLLRILAPHLYSSSFVFQLSFFKENMLTPRFCQTILIDTDD